MDKHIHFRMYSEIDWMFSLWFVMIEIASFNNCILIRYILRYKAYPIKDVHLQWAPTTDSFVTCSEDNTVRLWSLATDQVVAENLHGNLFIRDLMKIIYVGDESDDDAVDIASSQCEYQFLIARFMGPRWGPSGSDRTQVGTILASWILLSGMLFCNSNSSESYLYV